MSVVHLKAIHTQTKLQVRLNVYELLSVYELLVDTRHFRVTKSLNRIVKTKSALNIFRTSER